MTTNPIVEGSGVHFVTNLGTSGIAVVGTNNNAFNHAKEADIAKVSNGVNTVTKIYHHQRESLSVRFYPTGSNGSYDITVGAIDDPGTTATLSSTNMSPITGSWTIDSANGVKEDGMPYYIEYKLSRDAGVTYS